MARITYSTALVLEAIDNGYAYGFDIMDATGLPSGTVYPALRRLERDGLLDSRWEDTDEAHAEQRPARRYYELATDGATVLDTARDRFPALQRSIIPAGVTAEATRGER